MKKILGVFALLAGLLASSVGVQAQCSGLFTQNQGCANLGSSSALGGPVTLFGTSGHLAPFLDGTNTWTETQTFNSSIFPAATFKRSGGAESGIIIDTTGAGVQDEVLFADNGTTKWELGKAANNNFFLYDSVNAVTQVTAVPGTISTGQINIALTTASSSTGTGALVVAGGVGIGGSAAFGAGFTANALSTINFTGNTTSALILNQLTAANEIGLAFSQTGTPEWSLYKSATNQLFVYDLVDSVPLLGFTQGSASTAIVNIPSTTASTTAGTGALTVAGGVGIGGQLTTNSTIFSSGGIVSANPSTGVGYSAGAGGTQTQGTSRTTTVVLSKITGAITLFTAAGSATPATFQVTNTTVAATDTVIVNQKSGTNIYETFVTAVAAGSFNVTFFTTGGTSSDAPVFNFSVIKGAAS
jgi:hypothetical protein